MTFGENRKVSPFGLWPQRTSAVVRVGSGQELPDPTYVFHSDYVTTREGTVTFSGQFEGLQATSGSLSLKVRAMPYASEDTRTAKKIELSWAEIAANDGRWEVSFTAKPKHFHAVVGRITSDTDAKAGGLVIDLDGWGDGSLHQREMLRARGAAFGRPSRAGRGWWSKASPVEEAGLISSEPATIAEPASQMCTAAQMEEPAYGRWLAKLDMGLHWHRKQWEMIYILAVLETQGALRPGARGLGFGCGAEYLPSYFAAQGCSVLATDMPVAHQQSSGWLSTGQHSTAIDQLHWPSVCDEALFRERVSFRPVDMTTVPADLTDYDFCWSGCAFEHLGSIDAGLRFIHDAVRCLKPGGIAVHTTELNLSSDSATIDNHSTVLFRRRDMERLALELTAAGHRVLPLKYDQGDRPLDLHIDVPPFAETNHLKIAMRQFVTTSFGIAVVRGPQPFPSGNRKP